jgi:hypothetical protein
VVPQGSAEYRRISGLTDTPCNTIEPATTTKVISASIRLGDAGIPVERA